MIALAASLAACLALGGLVERALRGGAPAGALERLGRALAFGLGIVGALSMAVDALGIGVGLTSVGAAVAVAVIGGVVTLRAPRADAEADAPEPRIVPALLLAFAFLSVFLAVRSGWIRPAFQWDAINCWMFKAKGLFVDGTIFGPLATEPDYWITHQRYPPLISHVANLPALVSGSFDDRIGSAIFPWFAVALVGVVHGALRRRAGALTAAFGAVWIATLPLLAYINDPPPGAGAFSALADIPLALFLTGAVLAAADGIEQRRPRAWIEAGLLLGLATLTKNEGLPLIAILPVGLLAAGPRRYLGPALLVAAIAGAIYFLLWGLPAADLPALDEHYPDRLTAAALADGLARLPAILSGYGLEMVSPRNWNVTWLAVVALAVLSGRALLSGAGRVILFVVLAQLAAYVFALVITAWDSPKVPQGQDPVVRLINLTTGRLLLHVAPLAIVAALMHLRLGKVAKIAPLLLAAALLPGCSGGDGRYEGANLIVVSIDTLRADRLGCYGYDRGTSPNLDALAAESIVFDDVYANSPKTASSHMTAFTSLLPTVHGVSNASPRLGIRLREMGKNRTTLFQVLNRNGYRNACVANGGNLKGKMGFERGFAGRFESYLRDVTETVDLALEQVRVGAGGRDPFCVFLHTYQVHSPYAPPPEYEARFAADLGPVVSEKLAAMRRRGVREQFKDMSVFWEGKEEFGDREARDLSNLYDGEVAYTDEQLGRFIDRLRESGVLDDSILVVMSDHGEEFAEHGDFEHEQLYPEQLHVPLIVRLPGGAHGGTRVSGMASLLDLMPTVLDLLALKGPGGMMGQSLVPAIETGRAPDRPVLAEHVHFPGEYAATLRTPGSAITFHEESSRMQSWDLRADPAQQDDLGWDAPFFDGAYQGLHESLLSVFTLRAALDSEDEGGTFTLDEEARQELLELNYVGSDADLMIPEGTPLDRWPEGR